MTRCHFSKLCLLLAAALCTLAAKHTPEDKIIASAYQVDFLNGSLEQALTQGGRDGKHIFVHTTSSQCLPCDHLAQQLFVDQSVADFYNTNFVNFKLNVDDPSYLNIAQIHGLGKSPAMLYFSPKGFIVKKETNVNNAMEFINTGATVLNLDERTEMNYINLQNKLQKYEHGEREVSFLHDLCRQLKTFNEPYNRVVNEYLNSLNTKEMRSPKNRKFVYDFSDNLENDAIDYFLLDVKHFKEVVGGHAINEKVKMAIYNTTLAAIRTRDKVLFDRVQKVARQVHLPNSEAFLFFITSEFFEGIRDWENFAKTTIRYFDKFQVSDPYLLNHAAYKFYLYLSDRQKNELKKALEWTNKSIQIDSEYYNNFTAGLLLNRLGKCRDAIKSAEKAIEIAELRGNVNPGDASRFVDNLRSRNCR